jgi:hypothetical protein
MRISIKRSSNHKKVYTEVLSPCMCCRAPPGMTSPTYASGNACCALEGRRLRNASAAASPRRLRRRRRQGRHRRRRGLQLPLSRVRQHQGLPLSRVRQHLGLPLSRVRQHVFLRGQHLLALGTCWRLQRIAALCAAAFCQAATTSFVAALATV